MCWQFDKDNVCSDNTALAKIRVKGSDGFVDCIEYNGN